MNTQWTASLRYVDTEIDRPRWRSTLSYRLVPKLQVGVEANYAVQEVDPVATWFLVTEKPRVPAVFLGTSSDRIGSPKGKQAYYVTAAKNVDPVPASLYVTVNWSGWDRHINFPFGANVEVLPRVTINPMYDGNRTHLLATYSANRFNVTVINAWLERWGVAVSAGF